MEHGSKRRELRVAFGVVHTSNRRTPVTKAVPPAPPWPSVQFSVFSVFQKGFHGPAVASDASREPPVRGGRPAPDTESYAEASSSSDSVHNRSAEASSHTCGSTPR